MKILFLTSRVPYPPYRGDKLRLWNMIRLLPQRHEVTLLSFVQNAAEERWRADLERYCARVEFVRLPLWQSLARCVAALPGSIPFQVAYFTSPRMEERLRELEEEIKPDIVHVHLIRMAQYAVGPSRRPRLLDLCDAISLYLQRFEQQERNPLKRMVLRSELRRMLLYEKVISRFSQSVICSALDRTTVQDHVPGAHVSIVRNGVDLSRFVRRNPPQGPDRNRIIFTGNMSYFPNADGAEYFVRAVFPHVRREVPDACVYLVGQNPPRRVRALAGPGVFVTGFVDDIAAEYARSAVAVAPIRFGAGTLTKLLEPMAMGIPVVTTSMGSGGIDLVPGEDLLVADEPGAFAMSVVRLLRDQELGRRIGDSAAGKVRALYGSEDVVATLEQAYADAKSRFSAESRELP